ncbi:MAG: aldehyde ferredoxin oxidoreductase N-terminal domain-containing protein [Candidatus Hodarchaeota archaeon]
MKWNGYTGNILHVNLREKKTKITNQNIDDIKKFIGGFGVNVKLAAELIKPNISPFSSKNYIIIGAGPLVGTITPGSSRTVGVSKFPASGAIGYSCGSMSFGSQLKNAGFDHIIISSKAEKPSYLLIQNNHVELKNGYKIWGTDIVDSTNFLQKKYKDCSVIAIGQAGENLVYNSLALIDKTSTFGRGGLGAVMGSKNLKAIVVQGTQDISIAYPNEFNNLYFKLFERIRTYPLRESWIDFGMLRSLPVGALLKVKGQKEKAHQCSESEYLKKLKKRRIACPSCPMADKDILELKDGCYSGLINYTSSVINPFLIFTLEGLNNVNENIKFFDLINRYGLDALNIKGLFEFLDRMYKIKILSEQNTGLDWKNEINSMIRLIEMIVFRKGFGNILADGWEKLGESYENLIDRMTIVKGLDIVFEPRLLRLGTMEFEQVVNPKGAHVASGGSPTYVGVGTSTEKFKNHFDRMGIPKEAIKRIFSPSKKEMIINIGRITKYSEDWYALLSSLGLCARAQMNRFWSLESATNFYNVITGINLKSEEIRKAAERSWNLLKILNTREGFSRNDDKFPEEWFKPLKYGKNYFPFKDFFGEITITQEIANQLLDDYYEERGWNIFDGNLTEEKIKELDLEVYINN